MSNRKQRMQALKELLAEKPLYLYTTSDNVAGEVRCYLHPIVGAKKKRVAIYQLTNYGETYRKCEFPGCTYHIKECMLP